jgi:hypothetical protein
VDKIGQVVMLPEPTAPQRRAFRLVIDRRQRAGAEARSMLDKQRRALLAPRLFAGADRDGEQGVVAQMRIACHINLKM